MTRKRPSTAERHAIALERSHRVASWRASNREVFLAQLKATRLEKKLAGICRDCPRPSLEDNLRCQRCRKRHIAEMRRVRAKQAEVARIADAAYRPIDEIVDLNRVRILRGALHLDWFVFSELREVLGHGDGLSKEANTMLAMLVRLRAAGFFERRRSIGTLGIVGTGATYEYRITQVGRDELGRILRGEVRNVFTGRRRAA